MLPGAIADQNWGAALLGPGATLYVVRQNNDGARPRDRVLSFLPGGKTNETFNCGSVSIDGLFVNDEEIRIHGLALGPDQNLYALGNATISRPDFFVAQGENEHFVVVISPDGKVVEKVTVEKTHTRQSGSIASQLNSFSATHETRLTQK